MLKSIEIILEKWAFVKFSKILKCTDLRTTPIEQYFLGGHLRTTPFDQYFLGIDFFKNLPNRVELVLKIIKLRTTPFEQYSTEGRPFLIIFYMIFILIFKKFDQKSAYHPVWAVFSEGSGKSFFLIIIFYL